MTWRLEITRVGDVDYVSGYRLVAEHRGPEDDLEVDHPIGQLVDARGKLRWALRPNPSYGARCPDGALDQRRRVVIRAPQEDTLEEVVESQRQTRREAISAALPDILLAVADGAELRDAVRQALTKAEAPDVGRG